MARPALVGSGIRSLLTSLAKTSRDITRRPEQIPYAVYRHFDEGDRLLYVGISNNVGYRAYNHAKHSLWARFASYGTIIWYPTERAARDAERRAIENERPVFNIQFADEEAAERIVEYVLGGAL